MSERERAKPAFELAVGALSRKERTEAELRNWLAQRCEDTDEVEEAISRLIELGSLDDERFARLYAEDKRELRGWGPERIRESLIERGIARHLAEAAGGSVGHAEQVETATRLLRERGGLGSDDASRNRALGYLVRRGYDTDVAYAAVRRACADAHAGLA